MDSELEKTMKRIASICGVSTRTLSIEVVRIASDSGYKAESIARMIYDDIRQGESIDEAYASICELLGV